MFVAVKPYFVEYFISVDEVLVLDTSDWSLGYISIYDLMHLGIPIRLDCFDCQHRMYTLDFSSFVYQNNCRLGDLKMQTRLRYRLGNTLLDIDEVNNKSIYVNDIEFSLPDSFSLSAFLKGLGYVFRYKEYFVWRFCYHDLLHRQAHLSIATGSSGEIVSIWNAFDNVNFFGNKGLALKIEMTCKY